MPHVTAIGANQDGGSNIATAGIAVGQTAGYGLTSAASSQIGAMVAGLQELNPALKMWPEVAMPGLMVSANRDTDGVWLNLHDGWDDIDGAGLPSGYEAWSVLALGAKVDGGNAAAVNGHDYGSFVSSTTPAGSFYYETWNLRVPAGKTLRASAMLRSTPTCPTSPGETANPCTANPFPTFGLFLYENGNYVTASINLENNYQFIKFTNGAAYDRNFTLRIWLVGWSGVSSTTYGMAWRAGSLD